MSAKIWEVKRNHHYVWADYLRRWSEDGKNIWHTTQTRKVRLDSIRALSKQEYFYKASPLLPAHITIIEGWFKGSPDHLREQHANFLTMFMEIQAFERLPVTGRAASEVSKVVNILRCNTLEDRHALHEREARPIMGALAEGDFSILNKENNLLLFLVYFGHQISRTKASKESFLVTKPTLTNEVPEVTEIFKRSEECWWLLSYMFGMNIGWSLYSTRKSDRHCLLLNDTLTDFITSDQPIINVHPDLIENSFKPPSDDACDFLYPISPKVAFMINRSETFPHGVTRISEGYVHDMNQRIAKSSDIHIFGTSKQAVELYKPEVGSRQRAAKKHFSA